MAPHRQRIPDARFAAALSAAASRKLCWDAGKYLGSMLFFYFGRRIPKVTRRGLREGGQIELSVYDCRWKLLELKDVILTSDTIGPDFGLPEHVKDLFIGSAIEGFKRLPSERVYSFLFSNDLVLKLDTSNAYGADDAVAEVRLEGGHIFSFSPRGQIFRTTR